MLETNVENVHNVKRSKRHALKGFSLEMLTGPSQELCPRVERAGAEVRQCSPERQRMLLLTSQPAWGHPKSVDHDIYLSLIKKKSHVVDTMISLSQIMSKHVESRSVCASHMLI